MKTLAYPLVTLRWLILATGLLLAALASAPAGAGERLTVVELFTSQSCPLCPSADAFLGEPTKRDDVLALSFHVGYWDYIGWTDPFAKPAYTKRQEKYLDRFGLPYVFTPQAVVDAFVLGKQTCRSKGCQEDIKKLCHLVVGNLERVNERVLKKLRVG
jgi:hypothetical protein